MSGLRGHGGYLVILLHLLSVLRQPAQFASLTIDNRLAIVANDCFTRISIGSKLPDAVTRSRVKVLGISECEELCSKNGDTCKAFTFGVDTKGNGSCAISARIPASEDLEVHSDYDVYIKRRQYSPWCDSDRLYGIGAKLGGSGETTGRNETNSAAVFGDTFLGSIALRALPFARANKGGTKKQGSIDKNNRFIKHEEHVLSDNERRQISDIVANKWPKQLDRDLSGEPRYSMYLNEYEYASKWNGIKPGFFSSLTPSQHDHQHETDDYEVKSEFFESPNTGGTYDDTFHSLRLYDPPYRPALSFDGSVLIDRRSPTKTLQTIDEPTTNYSQHFLKEKQAYKSSKGSTLFNRSKENRKGPSNFGTPILQNTTPVNTRDNGLRQTSDTTEPGICYRKLQAGKKTSEVHVGRIVKCDNVQDCRQACSYEKAFGCEGFNYRRAVDNSDGSCELTSTPYPRMDIRKDFVVDPRCDYYEKHRDCSSSHVYSWLDPFISRWNDRPAYSPSERPRLGSRFGGLDSTGRQTSAWSLNQGETNGYPYRAYGNNRPTAADRPFYRETLSSPAFRESPTYNFYDIYTQPRDRNVYGGNFDRDHKILKSNGRGSYDYHRDAGPRNTPNTHWQSPDTVVYAPSQGYQRRYDVDYESDGPPGLPEPRFIASAPKNEHFYGKFYNYGGAFGYGEKRIPPPYTVKDNDALYSGNDKCPIKVATGSRLNSGVVQATHLARDINECEAFCFNEKQFPCASFAYRYAVVAIDPTNNCLLSDLPYRKLNLYTDLEPDRDYDVYSLMENSKACYSKEMFYRNPSDECFSRFRSGFGMPTDITKKSVVVDGLGDCQVACTTSEDFLCRSFAFRYATENSGNTRPTTSANCFLTDWPSRDINPVDMPDVDGAELYERGSFARGCEYYPPFALMEENESNNKLPPTNTDQVCYSSYHRPCRLMPRIVISSMRVDSESDCRRKCTVMRTLDPVPCMSFSYKIRGDPAEDNCLMSDVSLRDLRPNQDFIRDNGHVLYAWQDLDASCNLQTYPTKGDLPYPTISSYPDDRGASGAPNIFDRPFVERPLPGVPFRDGSDNKPENNDGRYHEPRPFDLGGGPPYDSGAFERGLVNYYPRDFDTFQRYTVNGHPCKNGTVCQRNQIAGFWSCEVDEGEFGTWDYCCEPKHRCGFSRGFHYPWCYVGPNEDQWRPCSETYYPYYLPSDDSHQRELPQYAARRWPVIFLHDEPPPNCTHIPAAATNSIHCHDRSRCHR